MPVPPDRTEALARTTLLVRRDIYPQLTAEQITTALTATTVRLTASKEALATLNGQTALVTSAILSAQLGVELHFDFKDAMLLAPQPPLRGEGLRESLLDLTRELITPACVDGSGEFNIAVGMRPRGIGVAIGADDWGFDLATGDTDRNLAGNLPFGAALGAVAASAELFRYTMVHLGQKTGAKPLLEQPLRGPRAASYRLVPFDRRPTDLGAVDSVSAGALTTAALYLLLRVPGLHMQARFIDADIGALTNLNRYLLLRRSLVDMPKTEALATYGTELIAIESEARRFDENSASKIRPLAERVIVGVDDIPSRWTVQAAAPGWVGVAATSHFEVVVSEHIPASPCAGCLHPHDDPGAAEDIPTVSFVSAMSGFLLAYRLLREGAARSNPSQTLAYPFNFLGERPVWDGPLSARGDCPVGCTASSA
jgi:hypothetical protein